MTDREQLIQRYLLGGMTEDECAALEQEYFQDSYLFNQIVQAESELVDKYARGLLTPEARERFEQHYLSHPARRERARFAEALAAQIERKTEVAATPAARAQSSVGCWLAAWRGPKLAWGLSMALLLAALAATLIVFQERRMRQSASIAEVARSAQEPPVSDAQPQPTNEQKTSEAQSREAENRSDEQPTASPAPLPPAKASSQLATLTLTITGTRSADEGPSILIVPTQAKRIRLQLNLRESSYARYALALQTAGGAEVFTRRQLAPRTTKSGARLALEVPARALATGDYILTLKGIGEAAEVEDISKSLIRVVRK